MKLIKTVDAEGAVLCHDITQIIKGVTKDAVFRKGHIVAKEDIPVLLSVGKDQLYVWEKEEGMLHENEAAEILCSLCKGNHMERSEVKEGKIELTADCDGLLKVDNRGLKAVNGFGQMMIATRHGNFAVKKGDKLAGTRIIPLVIEEEKMKAVRERTMELTGGKPILELKPFQHKQVGIVTTGNEVFHGRIKDTFTPVIVDKLSEFDTEVIDHVTWDDDDKKVTASILDMIDYSLRSCVERNITVRRCKNCGRWFPQTGRVSAEYCERPVPKGQQRCRDIGALKQWTLRQANNDAFKAYRKEYKRRFAWIKAGRITGQQFYDWSERARAEKDKCEQGLISQKELETWLKESK